MGSTSNLSELTVTCRQCGSASMDRIGDREYRCTHCGAITIVSQDGVKSAPVGPVDSTPAVPWSPEARRGGFIVLLIIVIITIASFVIHSSSSSTSPSSTFATSSSNTPPAAALPLVPASELAVTQLRWANDRSGSNAGSYTGLVKNNSSDPVQVPDYNLDLFVRGQRVDRVNSSVPVATLLPGESEPIVFAVTNKTEDTTTELKPSGDASQADHLVVPMEFSDQQLLHEAGSSKYRLIGVIVNKGPKAGKNIKVAVMLFDSAHLLIGHGDYSVSRVLRAGDHVAIEVDIQTTNVNPVATYEFLVDAADDQTS